VAFENGDLLRIVLSWFVRQVFWLGEKINAGEFTSLNGKIEEEGDSYECLFGICYCWYFCSSSCRFLGCDFLKIYVNDKFDVDEVVYKVPWVKEPNDGYFLKDNSFIKSL